jgi:uncharacterized protein (TIGR03067 family)
MAGLLVAAWAGAGEDAAKADHKKMKGQWQLKSEIKDGEERPAEVVKSVKLTFDGTGGWVLKKDDEVLFQGTSKANPSRSPKQLDLTLSAPEENKGLQIQAIYELKGDTFRICWTINGERPTEFEAKDSSGRTYSVFKRAKAK